MSLSVALQMDPLHLINVKTDSTLKLGLEAQHRGYKLLYYMPDNLTYQQGKITARGHEVTLYDSHERHYALGPEQRIDLSEMDVILLRQDPPFDMHYLTTTYLLEQLHPETLVVNNPASVRNYPEKIFPTLLEHFMPPTMITRDLAAIEAFRDEFRDIIIKPLYGHGGRSVVRLTSDDANFHSLVEMFQTMTREPMMVQQFLPEVRSEDRRIILVGGEVAGAVGRIPAEDDIRANFRVGGQAARVELTPRQQEICEALGPILREEGIIFAGLDVIGDYLTEVNITSPTGIVAINTLMESRIETAIWDAIEETLALG